MVFWCTHLTHGDEPPWLANILRAHLRNCRPLWESREVVILFLQDRIAQPEYLTLIPNTLPTTPVMVPRPASDEWPVIPGYRIVQELGRGGMGVVYKAHQAALNRLVAIKMILTDSEFEDRIRFLAEAEAVAAIVHPNVVQIHAFGQIDDRPYLVMEFVGGNSLAALLKDYPRLPAQSAASLVSRIARGVQAVHDAGITHRDLKPGNILLGTEEGPRIREIPSDEPEEFSQTNRVNPLDIRPKVSDFGIAKRGRSLDLTLTGIALGTPSYMAPEQASCQTKLVGPRSDIHALGVILFECLTGRLPFDGDTPEMVMYRVVEHDPPKVSQFVLNVPRALEQICEKALAKNPEDRYASAADLADDLDRFLAGDFVSVASPSRYQKAVRWIRKRPSLAAAYALGAMALMFATFTVVAVSLWIQADEQRDRAETALREVQHAQQQAEEQRITAGAARADADYVSAVRATDLAYREYEFGNVVFVRQLLESCPPRLRSWEWHFVNRLVISKQLEFDLAQRLRGFFDAPGEVVFAQADMPQRIAITSDGRHFLTVGNDVVRVWDSRTATTLATVQVPVETASVSFSTDAGRVTIVGQDGSVREWRWREGRLESIGAIKRSDLLERIAGDSNATALSSDRLRIAIGNLDGSVQVRDANTGEELRVLLGHHTPVKSVSFSPDGTRLATVSVNRRLKVWDVGTGYEVLSVRIPHDVAAVGWSSDGTRLAAVGTNHARILDATPLGK